MRNFLLSCLGALWIMFALAAPAFAATGPFGVVPTTADEAQQSIVGIIVGIIVTMVVKFLKDKLANSKGPLFPNLPPDANAAILNGMKELMEAINRLLVPIQAMAKVQAVPVASAPSGGGSVAEIAQAAQLLREKAALLSDSASKFAKEVGG